VLLLGSIPLPLYGFHALHSRGKPDGQYENTTTLVTTGVYKYIRHPLYASLMLVGTGVFFKEITLITGWSRLSKSGELPFKAAYAIRPGFIKPIKGMKKGYKMSRALGTLYPLLKLIAKKYVCTLEEVGLSMVHVAANGYENKILECVDIQELGKPF
jgi:hypothetical protein